MGWSWDDYEKMTGERHDDDPRGPKSSSAEKSLQGRANQAHGGRFEAFVESKLEALRRQGRADVYKSPEPLQPVSTPKLDGPKTAAVWTSKAWVDYSGHLFGGRAVHFEAKTSSADPSFPFGQVDDHQREILERVARFGAVSFLYVQRRSVQPYERYVFPVEPGEVDGRAGIIAGVDESSRYTQSIRWADADQYRITSPDVTWLDKLQDLELVDLEAQR